MLRSALIGFFVLYGFALPVAAVDSWPAFRGPTADGDAGGSDLPIEWSETRSVAWKIPLPGSGWSTPVVAQEMLYLTAAVPVPTGSTSTESTSTGPTDLSLRVLAIDANDGAIKHDVEVFQQLAATAPAIHSKNSHASPTPIIDGQQLFVHFGHQGTACLDRSGHIVWRNRDFRYSPVHGNGGSPIVFGDKLIFSCDGGDESYIVGLSKATGELAWRTDRETDASRTFSFSTPAVIEVDGAPQLISPGSNTVDALDPRTGELIWQVRYDGYSVIPQPIFGHGLVYVCSGYDSPALFAIRPTGRGDVTDTHVVWRNERHIPHTPSIVLAGDELYMVSDRGVATCRDARSGRVHWQHRLPGGYSASPILAGDRLYFLNEDGEATVLQAGKTYVELAKNAIGERTLASFAVLEDTLFIRGDANLYRLSK